MGGIHDFLGRFERAQRAGNGWDVQCPAHDDAHASLSVTTGEDGRILLHCHAGCACESIVAALGIELRDLFVEPLSSRNGPALQGRGDIVAEYDYVDEEGRLLFQVVRIEPGRDGRSKDFLQRRPNGKGGWSWKVRGVRRVLYRLPEVIAAARAGRTVIIVEGEKDADRLAAAGLVATTNPGGSEKWRDEYGPCLEGAHVVVLPDNDAPGRRHARQVARSVFGRVVDVRIVELPNLPEKGDVSDWLDNGGTIDKLKELVRETPALTEPPPVEPAEGAAVLFRTTTEPTLTDTGNSTRLVRLHGEKLHYVAKWDKWFVWDGAVWQIDDGAVRVRELAKDVGREIIQEAADVGDKKLAVFGFDSLSSGRIGSMVNLARGIDGVLIDHSQLDVQPYLLGVENGVLNLRTGKLRNADPADLMSMQAPVEYDPAVRAPRFAKAMEEWFPDPAVRAYVQRLVGAALVGLQRDHVFVIHYGGGSNGKGTFMRALRRALGRYCVVIHLSLIEQVKFKEHDTEKAHLFRARIAIASETERRIKLAEASVKNLTGGDPIHARRMREDPWEFDPTHSLWLQTNHLPQIAGRDTGIWRRIRVVKWVSTFLDEKVDHDLDAKLAAEAPGILRWAVEGCLGWQRDGLAEPEAVIRDTLEYRKAEDTFTRFADEVGLVFDPSSEIDATEIQQLLTEWAEAGGSNPPRNALRGWLEEHNAHRKQRRAGIGPDGKERRVWYWRGIGRVKKTVGAQ